MSARVPDAVFTRLEALAAEFALPVTMPHQLAVVLGELQDEHASITTVRDPVDAVERHVADALTGLRVSQLQSARCIADLGSGGGFPGLVLAAGLPDAQVYLVESVGRKCEFLARVCAAASLSNVTVVCARAEAWDDGLGRCDVVTARALARLNVLCEYAAPLLAVDGHAIFWKGRCDSQEQADGVAAAEELGLVEEALIDVSEAQGPARNLYVYRKIAPTPSRYPRRVGVAAKRPLTAAAVIGTRKETAEIASAPLRGADGRPRAS